MSAESSLTAAAVVRALLDEDTEGLAVLLPGGLPEPGRQGGRRPSRLAGQCAECQLPASFTHGR
jgi:hypothetical protein